MPATADEIVVTAGAQHSLLAALATLTRPGDAVLTEAVTYTGAISVANHLHLRLVPVPVDAGGLDVDAFARAAKRTGARVAYLMPTLQNPTGVTLSAGRRKALLQAAIKHDVTLIEDDEYGVFSSTLPLAADAPERCIYLTGVSKAVAPGLRVGLLRAPAALVPRLGAAVFASSVMAPPFGTELVGRWLADGLAERVIAWKRSRVPGPHDARPPDPRPARRVADQPAPVAADGAARPGASSMEQARLRGVIVSRRPELRRRGRAGAALRARLPRPARDPRGAWRRRSACSATSAPAADAARRHGVRREARQGTDGGNGTPARRRSRRDRGRTPGRSSTRRRDPRW